MKINLEDYDFLHNCQLTSFHDNLSSHNIYKDILDSQIPLPASMRDCCLISTWKPLMNEANESF